jgi:hypothetical protein
MSYTTQNPERIVTAIAEVLAFEGLATVGISLNTGKEWYATIKDPISNALVLVQSRATTATMAANVVTGQADPMFRPHVIKVGYRAPKAATGTIEVNAPGAGNTVVVNGVTFTAKAAGPLAANEFLIGASDDETAVNLKNAINASTSAGVLNKLTATGIGTGADADLITITAYYGGTGGNALTLADGGAGKFAVSGATLTGGTDPRTSLATLALILAEVAVHGCQVELYPKDSGDFAVADFGTVAVSQTIRNVPWGDIAHI